MVMYLIALANEEEGPLNRPVWLAFPLFPAFFVIVMLWTPIPTKKKEVSGLRDYPS